MNLLFYLILLCTIISFTKNECSFNRKPIPKQTTDSEHINDSLQEKNLPSQYLPLISFLQKHNFLQQALQENPDTLTPETLAMLEQFDFQNPIEVGVQVSPPPMITYHRSTQTNNYRNTLPSENTRFSKSLLPPPRSPQQTPAQSSNNSTSEQSKSTAPYK